MCSGQESGCGRSALPFGAVSSDNLEDTKKAVGWPEGQPTAGGVRPRLRRDARGSPRAPLGQHGLPVYEPVSRDGNYPDRQSEAAPGTGQWMEDRDGVHRCHGQPRIGRAEIRLLPEHQLRRVVQDSRGRSPRSRPAAHGPARAGVAATLRIQLPAVRDARQPCLTSVCATRVSAR